MEARGEGKTDHQASRFSVDKHLLASLGGKWENTPPFSGDEDRLYRWIAEPALWARVIMSDLEPRTQQRLIGLHAALHDNLDASGFVLWRALPPLHEHEGLCVTLHSAALPSVPQRLALPRVTIRQGKLISSSRFGEVWNMRSYAALPAGSSGTPAWLHGAWQLIQQATFPFLGQPMCVVDSVWAADRFNRTDAITHALISCDTGDEDADTGIDDSSGVADESERGVQHVPKRHARRADRDGPGTRQQHDKAFTSRRRPRFGSNGGIAHANDYGDAHKWMPDDGSGGVSGVPCASAQVDPSARKAARRPGRAAPVVVAAALETPFPAERLLRSLIAAGKDDDVLYIDAIVADRYGAAYRLLCDMVSARRALHPERRLVVVLMAVVSSDVIGRYMRWGFSYGGVVGQTDGECIPVLVDRIDRLHAELHNFEAAMGRGFAAPSPTSVVNENV